MKALSATVFGVGALLLATFATAAPAAAHSGVGVTIQIGHDRYYDDYGGYHYRHRACWNRWYRRHHPYECYRGLRHRDRFGWRYGRQRQYDDYWYWHRRHYPNCQRRHFHDHERDRHDDRHDDRYDGRHYGRY